MNCEQTTHQKTQTRDSRAADRTCGRGPDVEMKTSSPLICGKCGASMPVAGSVGETVLAILRTFDNSKNIQLGTSAPYYEGHADGIAFALIQLGYVTRDDDGNIRLK